MRNECCGAYISVKSPEAAAAKTGLVLKNAKAHGAEELVTACPLCMYNLKAHADGENKLEIKYITQLLYEALGLDEDGAAAE